MDLGLTGKRALVTGASAGLGLACAKALVASWLIDEVGWRDAYRIYAAVFGAAMLLCAVVARRPPLAAGEQEPIQ